MSTPTSAPPAPPSTPPTPPSRAQTAPPSSKKWGSKLWWFWAIVITALIGVGLWWLFKPSNAKAKGGTTPSDEFRRQPQGTNELSELRQKFAELSARLAAVTSNGSPATIATTNTTPTVTGLGVVATNVSSTVVSSNIYGPINTAGGNVNYTTISYGSPSNMVTMELMAWPSWVKAGPTNTFTAPGPRIKVGEMTTLRICKGHALEINLEAGYSLHPDVNDLQKVTMLWGDQRGCLTFDPDRQFNLPSGHVGPVRNLIWITPDSTDEAVEFRFMVVPK